MLLPLGIGALALLALGVAKRAAGRHSLPVDVAATVRTALKNVTLSSSDATKATALEALNVVLAAVNKKYPAQAQLIRNAVNLEGDTHLTPDVRAAYIAALHTGQPELIEKASRDFEAKYHYLAAHLRDVADVLSALRGVA